MNARNPTFIVGMLFCSLTTALLIVFILYKKELFDWVSTSEQTYTTVNNSCPTISYNHSRQPHNDQIDASLYDNFLEQRSTRLSRFNYTQFAEYLFIVNFDEIIGKQFDWRIQSHVDYYAENLAFVSLVNSGAKIVDSAVIRVNKPELYCNEHCQYDKSVSCWDNYQFVNFIDTVLRITNEILKDTTSNGFFIRYEFANVSHGDYVQFFASWPNMNQLLAHEISVDCASTWFESSIE